MINYTREQLNERYKSLPKDVQEAIIGVETADIIGQIGKEKKMMVDRIGELAEETGLVLLGFTHPSQFVSHLAERLGIEKSVAKEIAEEVNSRIFFPIRENLKKIHGLREEEIEEEEEEKTPFPTPLSPMTPTPTMGQEIKPAEMPISPQISEEETPVAPVPSPLPSALMPERVILETTIPTTKPEITNPLVSLQPETALPEIPVQPVTSIFEAKTKEGVFRAPAEVTEKKAEPSLTQTTENKKIDPYREQTI